MHHHARCHTRLLFVCAYTLTCAGVYGNQKYVFHRHFTLFPETDSRPELGLD